MRYSNYWKCVRSQGDEFVREDCLHDKDRKVIVSWRHPVPISPFRQRRAQHRVGPGSRQRHVRHLDNVAFYGYFQSASMENLVERSFMLTPPSGAELFGDIRWQGNPSGRTFPVIIVCHGFRAFKDWGPFPAIGRFLAESGFVSVVFNFSHNGIGKDFRKFSEPEKFSVNSFSLELDDVKTIVDAIRSHLLECPAIDHSKIGILGHSRGGGIALISGKEDNRIKAVAGWSTVAYFNRYTEGQRRRWRERGYLELPSMNPLSVFRLSTALLDDLDRNAERLNIFSAVEFLHKPLLLIHGTADLPVPLDEAQRLYEVSDKTMTQLVPLEGAGHMYGARHPYKKPGPTLSHVLELTAAWFHKHL